MGRTGAARRHVKKRTRRAGAMRTSAHPPLGQLDPEALLAHRELQYIRDASPERLRKLEEARALVARSR